MKQFILITVLLFSFRLGSGQDDEVLKQIREQIKIAKENKDTQAIKLWEGGLKSYLQGIEKKHLETSVL